MRQRWKGQPDGGSPSYGVLKTPRKSPRAHFFLREHLEILEEDKREKHLL